MPKVTVRFKKVKSGDFIEFDIAPILDQFIDMPFDDLQAWFYSFSKQELDTWIAELKVLKATHYVPPILAYSQEKGVGHRDQTYITTITKFLDTVDSSRDNKGIGRVYAPTKGFPMFTDVKNNQSMLKTSDLMRFEYENEWNDSKINQYVTIEGATIEYGGCGGTHFVFKNCILNIIAGTDYSKSAELSNNSKFINCTFKRSPSFRSSIRLEGTRGRFNGVEGFSEITGCTFDGLSFELSECMHGTAYLIQQGTFNKCVFANGDHEKTSDIRFVDCKLNDVTLKGISALLDGSTGNVTQSADWKDSKGERDYTEAHPTLYVRGDFAPTITLNEHSFGARIVNRTMNPLDVKIEPRQTKYATYGQWRKYSDSPTILGIVGNVRVQGDPSTNNGLIRIPILVKVAFSPHVGMNSGTPTNVDSFDRGEGLDGIGGNLIKTDEMFKVWTPTEDNGNDIGYKGLSLNGDGVITMVRSVYDLDARQQTFNRLRSKLGDNGASNEVEHLFDLFLSIVKKKGLYSIDKEKEVIVIAQRIGHFAQLGSLL